VSEHVAFAFSTELTLDEIYARLQQTGVWTWHRRDNDRWDNYLSAAAVPEPHRVMVKLFVEDGGEYVVDILFRYREEDPAARAAYEAARKVLFERLLPAIGAGNVRPAEPRE
jgi:hypothetical protein